MFLPNAVTGEITYLPKQSISWFGQKIDDPCWIIQYRLLKHYFNDLKLIVRYHPDDNIIVTRGANIVRQNNMYFIDRVICKETCNTSDMLGKLVPTTPSGSLHDLVKKCHAFQPGVDLIDASIPETITREIENGMNIPKIAARFYEHCELLLAQNEPHYISQYKSEFKQLVDLLVFR